MKQYFYILFFISIINQSNLTATSAPAKAAASSPAHVLDDIPSEHRQKIRDAMAQLQGEYFCNRLVAYRTQYPERFALIDNLRRRITEIKNKYKDYKPSEWGLETLERQLAGKPPELRGSVLANHFEPDFALLQNQLLIEQRLLFKAIAVDRELKKSTPAVNKPVRTKSKHKEKKQNKEQVQEWPPEPSPISAPVIHLNAEEKYNDVANSRLADAALSDPTDTVPGNPAKASNSSNRASTDSSEFGAHKKSWWPKNKSWAIPAIVVGVGISGYYLYNFYSEPERSFDE